MTEENRGSDKRDSELIDSVNVDDSQAHQPGQPQGAFDLGTVVARAKQVVTDPTTFYRNMPATGGYGEPIVFALVMGVAAGAVFAVLSILGLTGAGFAGVGAILAAPIGLVIGSFIGAAVLFVIWKLMGSPHGYATAYRCVAYSYAIFPVLAVLGIIPYLGTVIRVVWGTWLMFIASVEVHGRARQTAMLVFGILGLLMLFSSLSSERMSRNMEQTMQAQSAEMEQRLESLKKLGLDEDGEIDPEKAGAAIGNFMRSMQEASEGKNKEE